MNIRDCSNRATPPHILLLPNIGGPKIGLEISAWSFYGDNNTKLNSPMVSTIYRPCFAQDWLYERLFSDPGNTLIQDQDEPRKHENSWIHEAQDHAI